MVIEIEQNTDYIRTTNNYKLKLIMKKSKKK